MTIKPILFSGPMVRAILSGSKTQTRRVLKPDREGNLPEAWPYEIGDMLWCQCPGAMRRKNSRLTLEVTDVRIERVQDISEEDARAEGIAGNESSAWGCEGVIEDFSDLWDSLNAKHGYGWDANPWVVAITFKPHHCNVDQMEKAA